MRAPFALIRSRSPQVPPPCSSCDGGHPQVSVKSKCAVVVPSYRRRDSRSCAAARSRAAADVTGMHVGLPSPRAVRGLSLFAPPRSLPWPFQYYVERRGLPLKGNKIGSGILCLLPVSLSGPISAATSRLSGPPKSLARRQTLNSTLRAVPGLCRFVSPRPPLKVNAQHSALPPHPKQNNGARRGDA